MALYQKETPPLKITKEHLPKGENKLPVSNALRFQFTKKIRQCTQMNRSNTKRKYCTDKNLNLALK